MSDVNKTGNEGQRSTAPQSNTAFELLMSKEAEVRKAQETLKAQESRLGALSKLEELKAKKDVKGLLQALGLDPEETKSALEHKDPDLVTVHAKVDKMSSLMERMQEREEQQQREAVFKSAKQEVSTWLENKAEEYPLINKVGYQEHVLNRVLLRKQETGDIISYDEAAKELENELREFAGKLSPKEDTSAKKAGSATTTLTNSHQTEPRAEREKVNTSEDARNQALAFLNQTLSKS